MRRGKAKGRVSIRRMQMKLLEEGNATMGVWLGKNVLGQTDQLQLAIDGNAPHILVIMPTIQLDEDSDSEAIDVHPEKPLALSQGTE